MKNILALVLAFCVTMAPVLAQSGVSVNSGITIGAPKNPTVDAPPDAAYGVVTPNSSLPNARTLTGGSNISVTDGGAGGNVTFAVSGQIPVANGGTGASTQQGAANAVLNFPGLTSQDLFYYNGANIARFPKGAVSTFLQTDGSGNLVWVGGTGGGISGTAPVLMFGTDPSSTASRNVTAGTGISVTDGGALGNATFAIDSTVATLTGSQTLTNKVFTLPTMAYNAGSGFNLAGSTFNSALKWADWAAARNLTIPDPGADASFVMTEGAQTLNGVKTFGSTPVLSTGAFTVGGNTVTVPSATDTLVNLASTQSLSNKTISAPVFTTGYDLKTGSFALQHTWDAPAANRAYVIKDVGGAAHYVMKDTTSAYTAGAIPYGDGSKLVVGSAGTSGQPLLSGGTGAYTFGTLGPTVGGTNQTTYATGDTLYASGVNTLAKLAAGTNGHIMTLAAGVPTWAANAGSTPTLTLNGLSIMTSGAGSLTAAGTAGDLPYFSASNTTAKLGIGSTGQFLKVAAGIPSWGAGSSGFGGDGNAGSVTKGAVTETTQLQINSTTFSQTVSTTWAPLSGTIVNAISTCAFNGTTNVGTGCAGSLGVTNAAQTEATGLGAGLGGGTGMPIYSAQWYSGSGGGNGGAGGRNGSETADWSLPGGRAYPISSTGGSGGGGGAYKTTAGGNGGSGGGCLIACSIGAMTIGASGTVTADGSAGSAGGTGGGGGSGGTVSLNSQTSIANSGTINARGGNGGNGSSGAGGATGGGGYIQFVSPSNTNGTRTVTAGATIGTGGTQVPTVGTAGLAVSITATPNLPLLLSMQSDNFARMKSIALAHKVLSFPAKEGFDVELTQREAAQACSRGSVVQFARLVDGNMTESTCIEIGDSVKVLDNAA